MKGRIIARKILDGRSLWSFGVARCYLTLFILPQCARPAWSFIWTVAVKFFIPQYLEKLHLIHVPIKHVDHELDDRIPFKPEYLPVYMRFINFWLQTLAMLEVKFGIIYGGFFCGRYLTFLRDAYSSAYDIYSYCMSTTKRPSSDDRGIRALRLADPHYFCVPSLHIAIVAGTYAFYKKLFAEEDFTEGERSVWLSELKEEGLAIGRSVLYLKQHSVNCIPAALYMLCRIVPDFFTEAEARTFIESFLEPVDDILPEDKLAITGHIEEFITMLLDDQDGELDWTLPLKHWLDGYQAS